MPRAGCQESAILENSSEFVKAALREGFPRDLAVALIPADPLRLDDGYFPTVEFAQSMTVRW
ncbi:hypothetical protein [Nocardia africana]|uniref:Uncharacterized protein n=1 Tax=Nocardia africana TaxID=134964 RepID=A0ABW6NDJ8_9NOCA